MIPYILKTNSITLFPIGAAPLVVDATHMNFAAVRQAILDGDFETAVAMGSVSTFVSKISQGNVVVTEDGVTYKGQPLHGYLANKLVQFFNEGLDIAHYCAFMNNIMENPSMTSREELYLFLEAANLPITEDGCFLAYKAVNSEFKDKHSRTFDNSPGQVLSMERRNVDDNRERTCSYGFHAAAYEYAKGFMSYGDKLVAVKINPADVVSVPSDYNNQKLRTCRYEVMFEVPGAADTLTGTALYKSEPEITAEEWDDLADRSEWEEGYERGYDDGYENGVIDGRYND
jgi:hypothetical protein